MRISRRTPAARPVKKLVRKPMRSFRVPKLALRRWHKAAAGLLVLAVLVLWIFGALVLPEATVFVQARGEPVTRDFEIHVDKEALRSDTGDLVIPGTYIEKEVSGKNTFATTGTKNVGKKASGFVYIYNFSKNSMVLRAGTTVLTAGGKEYYFVQDIGNIRPTARIGLEDEEIDPSSLIAPVAVVAAAAGEQFNLPKGARLEIQNEVFGKQPRILYAVASENISGGSSKQVRVATAADIEGSFTSLNSQLVGNVKAEVLAEHPGLKLRDNAAMSEILEKQTLAAEGKEISEFETSMKIRFKALAYSEEEIKKIVVERIKLLLPSDKTLDEDTQRVQSGFADVSLADGRGVLASHFEGHVVYKINPGDLTAKLRGHTAAEIKEILLSRPEIRSVAEIRFYPFWVKKAPKFEKNIKIQVLTP